MASPGDENSIQKALTAVTLTRSLLAETLSLRKGKQYIPSIYRQLSLIFKILEANLTKTLSFVHFSGSEEDQDLALKIANVAEALSEKVLGFGAVLKQCKSVLTQAKWKSMLISGIVPWQEPKVNGMADQIMTYHVLLLRAGAPPMGSEEIAEIVKDSGVHMDWRTEEHVTDLKAYQRGSISGPAGIPNGLGDAGLTGSDVRRPSAFYNVYDGRIIGTLNTESGPIPQIIEGVRPKPLTATEEVLQKTVSRPGPAALQFESPHLGGLVLTASVPQMNLSLPEGDPARSSSVNSSQLAPPADPVEAFRRIVREIRNAKIDAFVYPGISLQVYRKALRLINEIPDKGASNEVLFLKVHYATICEIGLSRIEAPAMAHLGKALKHNERAITLGEKIGEEKVSIRAILDKAQIKGRVARVQSRTGLASKGTIRTTLVDAFESFDKVATFMRGNLSGLDDHHVLAQALLGCGKISKRMAQTGGSVGGISKRFSISSSSGKGNGAAVMGDPQVYLLEAIKVVEEGIAVGRVEEESDEAMEELALVSEDARRQLSYFVK